MKWDTKAVRRLSLLVALGQPRGLSEPQFPHLQLGLMPWSLGSIFAGGSPGPSHSTWEAEGSPCALWPGLQYQASCSGENLEQGVTKTGSRGLDPPVVWVQGRRAGTKAPPGARIEAVFSLIRKVMLV